MLGLAAGGGQTRRCLNLFNDIRARGTDGDVPARRHATRHDQFVVWSSLFEQRWSISGGGAADGGGPFGNEGGDGGGDFDNFGGAGGEGEVDGEAAADVAVDVAVEAGASGFDAVGAVGKGWEGVASSMVGLGAGGDACQGFGGDDRGGGDGGTGGVEDGSVDGGLGLREER